jgi:uncharacterized protein YndB with AHSA1/START domain
MTYDPETDLILTRDINAPRHLLWACWTTPAHLVHWFVPKPHRVSGCVMDLRVGGAFNTTFDIDGATHENKGVYLEVIPEEKLVFTDTYSEGWKPAPEPFMTAIITFEDLENGQTRYQALVRHRSRDAAQTHLEMGFHGGWGTAADQLEAHAQGLQRSCQISMTRLIAASPEQVWRCWAEPALLVQWFGPEGYRCVTREIRLGAGGVWRFDMIGPDGKVWLNRHRYTLWDGPRRLTFLMDDDSDDAAPHLVEVTLTPEAGGTRLTQVMTLPDAAARQAALSYGADVLGQTTLAKLAAMAEAL